MSRARRAFGFLIGFALAGCATLPDFPLAPRGQPGEPETDPTHLVGTWQGEVDLTFPDRTLIVHSVRRQDHQWVAEAEYGTTNVYLTPVAATVDTTEGRVVLRFVTQLQSEVALTLHKDDHLRGVFRLPNEDRDRPIDLKRVASAGTSRPSTALERFSQAVSPPTPPAPAAQPAAAPPGGPPTPPPFAPSAERNLEAALGKLLAGRWEGELDFAVSARILVIDSVRRDGDKWTVQARFGVADVDLQAVPVTLETTDDRVGLRFVSSLGSRVNLTLHTDAALRGTFKLAFEARERRIEFKKATTPPATPEGLAVAFRHPPDQARVTEASSVVAAIITSAKGVAQVSITLNGSEVHKQAEQTPPKSVVVSVPVTLRQGPNVIAITATEPDGTVRQELRTVIYDAPPAAVAAPAPPPRPKPPADRWAVVIGVGRYDHAAIPRLRYTVPDAEAIYQMLTGPAGFKKDNVLLLTDRTERKPTLRNLKWALGTFLARSAKKDDMVLIFFAGHGAPEVDQRGVEQDGLAKYLVPSDADPDDLFSSALPMDDIQTIFGRIEAERVVVFLDSCYSGAAGGRTFSSKKTRASHVDELFLERLTRSKGRAIITAARAAEVSIELPELGHGIFTYYLLQGLRGAADLNRDGIVSLQELYEYVEQQVTQKSRAVGGNQHPVMKGELEGVLPLMKVKP